MKGKVSRLLLILLLSLGMAGSAWAITLEEAAKKAAKQYNAKVISARTINSDGKRVHEIKLVTSNGVVKTVRIPEKS